MTIVWFVTAVSCSNDQCENEALQVNGSHGQSEYGDHVNIRGACILACTTLSNFMCVACQQYLVVALNAESRQIKQIVEMKWKHDKRMHAAIQCLLKVVCGRM